MERRPTKAFAKGEAGFSEFVVFPLFETLSKMYPELKDAADRIQENIKIWKEISDLKDDDVAAEKIDEIYSAAGTSVKKPIFQ